MYNRTQIFIDIGTVRDRYYVYEIQTDCTHAVETGALISAMVTHTCSSLFTPSFTYKCHYQPIPKHNVWHATTL